MVERQPGVEGAQLQLRTELEEAVGGEPRLLGLLVAAGADRRFELVERDRRPVRSRLRRRLRSIPRGRSVRIPRSACSLAASSSSWGATVLPCWALSTSSRISAKVASICSTACGSRFSSSDSRSEKAASTPSMKATASCTSKGIVTCPSAGPLVELFRDQVEEAVQLARPVDLLVGGQRRRGEALEVGFDPRPGGGEGALVGSRAGGGQALEVAVGLRPFGGSALLRVLGGDRPPVAEHDRRGFGEAAVEVALGRLRGFVEVRQQARLEGVEQVFFDQQRPASRGPISPSRQFLDRGRTVDPGAGEAGRLAEVADLQPFARFPGVAASAAAIATAIAPRRSAARTSPGGREADFVELAAEARWAAVSPASISRSSAGAAAARPARQRPVELGCRSRDRVARRLLRG